MKRFILLVVLCKSFKTPSNSVFTTNLAFDSVHFEKTTASFKPKFLGKVRKGVNRKITR